MNGIRRKTLLLVSAFGCLGVAATHTVVQVKGSDTIGGKLGPALAHAFMLRQPTVEVKWESLGSGTAFVGLFDGSAQLGASSRPAKEQEIAEARKMGVELHEYVIGYDGVAVIVHPDNPVSELSMAQISDIFTGKVKNWREVGGPDLAIHTLSRPSYSGTFSFFRDKVLRRGNDKGPEDYTPEVEIAEENPAILSRVSQLKGAISYVGVGWINASVKALAVAPKAGSPAVKAAVDTVRTGTYPIYRPLFIYALGEPRGAAHDLLAFVLSAEGRKLVAEHDFVPPDTAVSLPPSATGAEAAAKAGTQPQGTHPAARESEADARTNAPTIIRVQFPRGATLTAAAQATLAKLAAEIKGRGQRLLIVGHADAHGSLVANRAMALTRARAVADQLATLGVARSNLQIEGHAAEDPVATNDTTNGRRENRRVDIVLLHP